MGLFNRQLKQNNEKSLEGQVENVEQAERGKKGGVSSLMGQRGRQRNKYEGLVKAYNIKRTGASTEGKSREKLLEGREIGLERLRWQGDDGSVLTEDWR